MNEGDMQEQQQHSPAVVGERELTSQDVAAINHVRRVGIEIGAVLAEMAHYPGIDRRWLAIAQTNLQLGFMAAERAIHKPEKF
jgi:hypothetical protein